MLHIFDDKGKEESLDTLLKRIVEITWIRSLSNELGCLAQAVRYIDGDDVVKQFHAQSPKQ